MIDTLTGRHKSAIIFTLLGSVFTLLSFLANITFPLLLLSMVFMYKVVYLPSTVNYPIVRICVAFVLQLTVFNVLGLLFHLIGVDVSVGIYVLLSLLVASVTYAVLSTVGASPRLTKPTRFDAFVAIPVVIATVFLLLYIFLNGLSFSENLIRFMGSSSDQSAHLSMFNDILRNNGNHVYSSDKLSINTPGINSYPMGWHQAMAVFSTGLFGVNATTAPFINVISIYFFCALITFVLCTALLSVFTSLVYDKSHVMGRANGLRKKEHNSLTDLTIKTVLVLTVAFLFLYVTFCGLGYINFIYAVAIAFVCGILMIGTGRTSEITGAVIAMVAVLLFAVVEAWYIMAIPLGFVLASLLLLYLKKGIASILRQRSTWLIIVISLSIMVACLEILHNIMSDGSSEQIQIGNAAAPWLPNIFILLGVVLSALITTNSKKENLLPILVNGFFITVVVLTALNFLNQQEYSYYQQKMLYAFFALSLSISFTLAIGYMYSKGIRPLLAFSIILFTIYTINPGGILYMAKNIMRPTSDPEISIINNYFQSKFNDRSRVVFIKDYRTNDERFTESYARLMLSKVVSAGDCYNQLVMPLLSLGGEVRTAARSNMDANKAATRCYGNTEFFVISDTKPISTEHLNKP